MVIDQTPSGAGLLTIGLLMILLLPAGTLAASLEASVDRQSVVEGEAISLYLEGVDLQQVPDISTLYSQFEVLDSRTGEQINIVNGRRTAKNIWRYELMPRSVGRLQIPAFSADGFSSQPIAITVQARDTPGAKPLDDIFFEVSIDRDQPYVQSQVLLTVEIFDGADIASGSLSDPQSADFQIERLADDQQKIEARNGIEYRVITRRYAIFPQRSGELQIPALVLSANVKEQSARGSGMRLRYSRTRRVTIRSDVTKIKVLPRPAQSRARWWLPVEQVELSSEWSSDIADSRVGEPLTRTLVLSAEGALKNQLPELAVPSVAGLKFYPDNPQLESRALETGLISAQQQKWSVIPQKPGELTLPEITVVWWDTRNNQERETVLPAETIIVAAAAGVTPNHATAPDPTGTPTPQSGLAAHPEALTLAQSPGSSIEPPATSGDSRFWRTLALLAAAGWLLTALGWVWRSRFAGLVPQHHNSTDRASIKPTMVEVKNAASQPDPAIFMRAFMNWGRGYWPDKPPANALAIADRLGSAPLARLLKALDAGRYSSQPQSVALIEVYTALQTATSDFERLSENSPAENPLPSLSPGSR